MSFGKRNSSEQVSMERVEREETPLEKFQKMAEETRKRVAERLKEITMQEECIKILIVLDSKLDAKNGSAVTITFKGYGRFIVDNTEVIVRKEVTMEILLKVIDQVPAYSRGECSETIEPKVEVQFSSLTTE